MRTLPILLLLGACAGTPAQDCALERSAEIPLQIIGDVPVVQVQINGQQASLVLDTGSDATVLNRTAARRLGVAEGTESRNIGGAAGRTQVGVGRIEKGSIAGQSFDGRRVFLAEAPRPPLDGVLGIDVLVDYELDLDMPHRRATLYRARSCATLQPNWPGPFTPLAAAQQAGSGHLFVPVDVDNEPLQGMLDTGASRTTLSVQAAEDVRINQHRLRQLPGTRGQAINAEGLVVRMTTLRSMRLGGETIPNPALAIGDLPVFARDMLVGGDYFGTRRLWFSFRMGRVFVAPAS